MGYINAAFLLTYAIGALFARLDDGISSARGPDML